MNRVDTSQPWELTTTQQERLRRDITPGGQIERAAQVVSIQRVQRARVDALITLIQSSDGPRIFGQALAPKQRKPRASGGMITRSVYTPAREQPHIAAMQANLARLEKRGAAIERQVQRERAGRY